MEAVQHTTLVETTVQKIKELIESGEFKVGEKLPSEQYLCKRFSISRPTLREAYRTLETGGLLELRPGRGAFVRIMDEDERRDLLVGWFQSNERELMICFSVRETIELLAVRFFIEQASERELHELLGINVMFQNAVKSGDASKMAIYDEMFHMGIVKASHSKTLIKLSEQTASTLEAYRNNAFAVHGNGIHAVEPHNEIVDALMHKDLERAQLAMKEHLKISLTDIKDVIDRNM